MTTSILEAPLYTVGEAARLLGVGSTLRRWLDGFTLHGRRYEPVLRMPERVGSDTVTWAEFVEAGLLRRYRGKGVPLQQLRPVIDKMRREFGVPYPLAHFKPLVDTSKRQLVLRIQDEVGLAKPLALVRLADEQLQWAEPVAAFLDNVEFDADAVAQRWHPYGANDPVAIDPEVAFGIPQIRGIRTASVAETFLTTGTITEAADEWGLTDAEVQACLRLELDRATAA